MKPRSTTANKINCFVTLLCMVWTLALSSAGYPNIPSYLKETVANSTNHCPKQQTSLSKTSQHCEKSAQNIFDLLDEYAFNHSNLSGYYCFIFKAMIIALSPLYPIYKPPKHS